MFEAEVRKEKCDCLDKFLSTAMEENAHLELHMRNMHRIWAHIYGF
jgi:hypothetical protein